MHTFIRLPKYFFPLVIYTRKWTSFFKSYVTHFPKVFIVVSLNTRKWTHTFFKTIQLHVSPAHVSWKLRWDCESPQDILGLHDVTGGRRECYRRRDYVRLPSPGQLTCLGGRVPFCIYVNGWVELVCWGGGERRLWVYLWGRGGRGVGRGCVWIYVCGGMGVKWGAESVGGLYICLFVCLSASMCVSVSSCVRKCV